MRAGPTDSLTDVAGLRVGHATRDGVGWLTGTTVVAADPDLLPDGVVAGVDVRGGGPGTRETDLLDPRNAVQRVHAITLTGGSAFGLAAADGVLAELERRGTGLPVGPGVVVPIVPAAVVFDLARGGDVAHRPGPAEGTAAVLDALSRNGSGPVDQGCVGAGTGAVAGGLKGGVGSASAVLGGGATVAALVVVNAAGSVLDPRTGRLWGERHLLPGEPAPAVREGALAGHLARVAALRRELQRPSAGQALATTLVVVGTDLALDKARCAKVAGIAHDGLARAIDPVHTMVDGDTAFALATGARPEPDAAELHELLAAAGDVVTRAVVHAVLAATTTTTAAGSWPSYRDELAGGAPVS
ncbi:P1 family peptidase [Angustibacter aerolatus]